MSPQDDSAPASSLQQKELREVIGSLMYYARILDHTLLPAVTYLACFQAAPTLDTMAAMEHGTASRLLWQAPQCYPGHFTLPYARILVSDLSIRFRALLLLQ